MVRTRFSLLRGFSFRPRSGRRLRPARSGFFPCLLLLAAVGTAQGPATDLPPATAGSPPTVNPSTFHDTLTINAPWSVFLGDDPGLAQPSLDDSSWVHLRPGQSYASAGLPASMPSRYTWARIRLHVAESSEPLAIAIETVSNEQIEVFANGVKVASAAGSSLDFGQLTEPRVIPLPRATDVLIAVRIGVRPRNIFTTFQIARFRVGSPSALQMALDLARRQSFDNDVLTGILTGLVALAFVPLLLALFLAQRRNTEYLWLAMTNLAVTIYTLFSTLQLTGLMPLRPGFFLVQDSFGWATLVCLTEFVAHFAKARRRVALRIFEAYVALSVFFIISPHPEIYGVMLLPGIVFGFVLICMYLVRASRRGSAESGYMLVPFLLVGALFLADNFYTLHPDRAHFPNHFQIGYVGVGLGDVASVLFFAIIMGFVLARFISVSKEEKRVATELEAARTVQHLLIPDECPQIEGYAVASAYHPARQVGGDFFQILPLPMGATLIVLGDVSGKGMQAAMTVSLLVGALQSLMEFTSSPSRLMEGLDRRLYGRGTGFTTCVILHLSASGHITAANAGHLPPYLDGREVELEPGLPLGFTADAVYTETHFDLSPGTTLTLVTDGVVEATHSATRELFGFERTQAISMQTAAEIAAAAQEFGHGAPQADDITVLTLTRAGQAREAYAA